MINDGKIIHPVHRRMKCEASQSCRERATKVIGMKGVEFPVCDIHFKKLCDEIFVLRSQKGYEGMMKAFEEKHTVKEVVKIEQTPAESIEDSIVSENIEETQEEKEPVTTVHEYFVCKYCGEKFDKDEYTSPMFMAHCRKCKKEHEE